MKKVIYAVSLGPGNYEYMTIKAAETLKSADIIITSGVGGYGGEADSRSILEKINCGHKLKSFEIPENSGEKAHAEFNLKIVRTAEDFLNQGKRVAYAGFGDITVFTSYGALFKIFKERGITLEAVPGVSSFMAPAALAGIAVADWKEGFCVICMPEKAEEIDRYARMFNTVLIMKIQDNGKVFKEYLAEYNPSAAFMVLNAYMDNQQTFDLTKGFPCTENVYMSVIMVKK